MHLLSLNRDVLDELLTYLTPGDALRLGMTSRRSLMAAMPRLLSCVVLRDETHVPEILSFLLAAPLARIPHLKELKVERDAAHFLATSSPHLSELANVFRQAPRLRRLRLENSERILLHSLEFRDALVSQCNLNVIHFGDVGQYAMDLLGAIASRPREVSLENYVVGQVEDGVVPRVVPIDSTNFLLFTTENLEVLRLENCEPLFSDLHDDIQCIRVHTLSLTRNMVKLSILSAAFPNVRHLCIEAEYLIPETDGQQHTWQHLDSLITHTLVPLSKPVRRLCLNVVVGWSHSSVEVDIRRTSHFLNAASPTVLALSTIALSKDLMTRISDATLTVKYLELVIGPSGYESALEEEDVTSLEQLSIGPQLDLLSDATTQELWLLSRISGWAGSSLIALSVRHFVSTPLFESSHTEANAVRPKALATIFAAFLPRLEYVGICVEAQTYAPWDQSYDLTWFKVTSRAAPQIPELEELSAEDGSRVQRELWELQPH